MKHIFICKKNFWATSFLRGEIQIFVKKGLPKLSFKIGSNFSVILRFAKKNFTVRGQSQVFTITRQNYDRYMTTRKKIRHLAPKCAKLERSKVKRHKVAENQPI